MITPLANPAFKDCDIRGRYPDEVNESLLECAGAAFGRQIVEKHPTGAVVMVAGDARPTTRSLKSSFLTGLSRFPLSIVDLGLVPTPIAYWAKAHKKADACAIITASHNPPDWNGLKITIGDRPPTPDMIQALAGPVDAVPSGARASMQSWEGVIDAYVEHICGVFKGRGVDRGKVVLDPGNGCQSGIASRVFRELGADCTALHDRLDGTFPDRHPDSAIPGHLTALSETVAKNGADLGVAFDGDGDRISVVDGRGRVLGAERLSMVLLRGPLQPENSSAVILDVKCSMQLERTAEKLGAIPERCKSGHAYMKTTVLDRDAVLGVELSGHVFLGCLDGRDDPLYTALLLCSYLGSISEPLSEIVDGLPRMFITPDVRVAIEPSEIDRILDRCQTGLTGAHVETLDGVRLVWDDGWVLVRRSITEAKISIRLEGEDSAALERTGSRFLNAFPELTAHVETAIRNTIEERR